MGKKKQKPNAFSVFMREHIAKESRAGRRYPKENWAAVAKPHFDRLSAAEKEMYKQKAKELPVRVTYQPPKFTSQGIPLVEVEREERELAEKKRYMERKVKNMVENAFLDNDIKKKPFVFIMANYYYKTSSGIYSPAEIAVARFNFEDAITQKYQTFVDPGTVAIGYAFEAKERSAKVHRLPPPPDALGEKDYEKVYTTILNVLGIQKDEKFDRSDARRPCAFIRKQDIEMMESILDQLSNKEWQHFFDLFELELLFNELKNKTSLEPVRVTVTNTFIEQDRYDATPNISCDFHEKEDVTRHCALSYVQRWFYLFADHICQKIGVQLIPGKHLPSNARLEPLAPFEDDPFETEHIHGGNLHSTVSSSHTGYSRMLPEEEEEEDSSSDDY